MAKRKSSGRKRTPAKPAGKEYRFAIGAYSPESLPMARFAEYVGELATMLGEQKAVHFDRLDRGSSVIVHRIEREAIPKIRERTDRIGSGTAPRDAQVAFRNINRMLRDDNASAILREHSRGPRILYFPGVAEAEPAYHAVRQQGSITGQVERVGGRGRRVPVLLALEGRTIVGCRATRQVARKLGARLFEYVRVNGKGFWNRNTHGEWELDRFYIDSFDPLPNATLSDALTSLRALTADWDESSFEEVRKIRNGSANGRD
jgi:hypothetical protein